MLVILPATDLVSLGSLCNHSTGSMQCFGLFCYNFCKFQEYRVTQKGTSDFSSKVLRVLGIELHT